MRLFKRAPATWACSRSSRSCASSCCSRCPSVGPLLGEDRRAARRLRHALRRSRRRTAASGRSLRHALRRFARRRRAIAAIIAAGLLTFAAEALAAWWIAGANLLAPTAARATVRHADRRHLRHRHPGLAADDVRAVPRAVRARAVGAAFARELARIRAEHAAAAASTARRRSCCWASAASRWASGSCSCCRCGPRRRTPRGRTSSPCATRRRAAAMTRRSYGISRTRRVECRDGRVDGFVVDLDGADARCRRSAAAPRDHALDGVRRRPARRLDGAVAAIAHPAGDAAARAPRRPSHRDKPTPCTRPRMTSRRAIIACARERAARRAAAPRPSWRR